jgi:phage terminase large subunit
VGLSNEKLIKHIQIENKFNALITADSAEPKTIGEMQKNDLRVVGAKKGPDSVDYGIKFLVDLEEIIIDDERCPNTAREFLGYELEQDANGNWKSEYPDKDNHSIDMCRYALEQEIVRGFRYRENASVKQKPDDLDLRNRSRSKETMQVDASYLSYGNGR